MSDRPLASNRRARYEYDILETYEAGLMLQGWEIKSLRAGRCSLAEAYVAVRGGEAWLVNAHIPPYQPRSHDEQDPRRDRKLLLHAQEIAELGGQASAKGFTLVPLRIYLKRNRAKVEVGLARGKKKYDKREDIREREHRREMERVTKHYKL